MLRTSNGLVVPAVEAKKNRLLYGKMCDIKGRPYRET